MGYAIDYMLYIRGRSMETNRRQKSLLASLVEVQSSDKVKAIRESLVELKKVTAQEREFNTLTYLIGMALQEASAPHKA